MSIPLPAGEIVEVNARLDRYPIGEEYIYLEQEVNEIMWELPDTDIHWATSTIVQLLGVYHDLYGNNSVWLYYIPEFTTNDLFTFEQGKTYVIIVGVYSQNWRLPEMED